MAIEFYSSIDLNGNELQNAVVQNLGSAPSSPVEGQIYYDTGDDTIYFRDGSSWVDIAQQGDITGVTAGAGLTGGGTSGGVTLNVIGGTGITANANDIAIDSTVATLSGAQELTNKTIAISQVTELSNLTAAEGAQLENIGSTTISAAQWGYLGAATGAITNTNQLTTFTLTGDSGSNQTIAHGNTLDVAGGTGIDTVVGATDTLTVAIDSTVATLSGSQTLSNKTIAASQVTEISNITAAEGAQIENINSTTISATQWGYLGSASGAITNTDVDVSVSNLEARLPQIDTEVTLGNGVRISTGGDFIVTGNLTVSGDTTTVNTATLTVEDPLIKLASGNTSGDVVDIGFYGLYDNSGSQDVYTGLTRDASDDKWHLWKLNQAEPTTTVNHSGTGFAVDTLVANLEGNVTGDLTGDVTGNADTVTTNANLTGHITSSGNAAVLGSFTVAQLSSAISNASISGNNTGDEPDAADDTKGIVELATSAEVLTGTDAARAITPDTLAAKSVVATIAQSSLTDDNRVTITHGLGTADVIVQLFDMTTEANVYADIARTTNDMSTASTSVITIDFGRAPENDVRCLITSLKGATASGTIAYT